MRSLFLIESVKNWLSSIPQKIKSYGRCLEKKFHVEVRIFSEISFPRRIYKRALSFVGKHILLFLFSRNLA